jgi:hypothetical protein
MTEVVNNEELHDELVEDVEVTDEELLDEAKKVAEEEEEEMDSEEESEEEEEEEMKEDVAVEAEETFKEDLDALVDGEATLSEDFRGKAGLIFEAALKTKLAEHVSRLEESYAEQLAEETATMKADLVEKVDSYLGYVVESWMEENKLAVETGLRADITESFMDALQGVFAQHYITVPEGKADLVEELAQKVEELEESFNKEVDRGIELNEKVSELTREKIIREAAEGLSEVQAEKLKGLVEDVDFESAESFSKKVDTLKESYFKTKTTIKEEAEEIQEATEEKVVSDTMARYLDALRKSH